MIITPVLLLKITAIWVLWMIYRMLIHKSKKDQRYWARRRLEERQRIRRHLEQYEQEHRFRDEMRQVRFVNFVQHELLEPIEFDWRKEGF